MDTEQKFDVFISYKRISLPTANNLYYRLTTKGYSTFFDLEEMRSDDFDKQLLHYIGNAKDVFVILEEHSLDACKNGTWETDWFCREIMFALEHNKNIIPILLNGYEMPKEKDLPDKLKRLTKQDAPKFDFAYFSEYIERLIRNNRITSKPNKKDIATSVFKFYANEQTQIYKEGKLVCSLNKDADEPYYLPVSRKGDYRFKGVNVVTEEQKILDEYIDVDEEKKVEIKWDRIQKDHPPKKKQKKILDEIVTQELLLKDEVRIHLPENKVRAIVALVLNADGISFELQENFLKDLGSGLATAQNNLGFALKDPLKKIKWLEKAVENGSGVAMITLGKIYANGEGVKKNVSKALDYFRTASANCYHDEVVDLVNKLFVEEEEYESKDHEISPSNLIKLGDLYYELTDSDITSLKVVNHSTYKNCNILTIPEKINRHGVELTVKEIESYAFADCTSLLAITLPNSIKIIRKNAFENCSSLPLLIIPDSVKKIEDGAFKNCTSLKHITIPNDIVADSQMNLYDYCLKNGVYQSMDISSASIGVGDQAFYGCSAINSVTLTTHSIAEFCKGIGNDLLYRSGISAKRIIKINDVEHPHIKIPNEIKYIRNRTFYKCSTLEVVTIPETVLEINSWAFEGCNSLSTIKYTGTMQKWAAIKKGENWNNGVPATVIHCTDGDVEM